MTIFFFLVQTFLYVLNKTQFTGYTMALYEYIHELWKCNTKKSRCT